MSDMTDEELCRSLMADRRVAACAARFREAFPDEYPETPDAFTWLAVDADAAVRMGCRDGLIDTGCLDPNDEALLARYERAFAGEADL